MYRRGRLAVVLALFLTLAVPTVATPPRPLLRDRIREAEMTETLSPEAPDALADPFRESVTELPWRTLLLRSEQELQAILPRCTGTSAEHRWARRRTLASLAAHRYWLGQYAGAATAAEAAYRAGEKQAAVWAQEARRRARVVNMCRPLLGAGERCLAAEPLRGMANRWVLLTAVGEDMAADGESFVELLDRHQLVLIERSGNTSRVRQRVRLPGEYNSVRLLTGDVNRDGTADVIALGSILGGSW
jgi:hypothetical protein